MSFFEGCPNGELSEMNILLTNDDGIYAEGLWALCKRFAGAHTVTVVAPDRERSGIGHGITLNNPLRTNKIELNDEYTGYAVNGTPVDCVKLGVLEILDAKPDMVISGINPGANTGANLNYSGTVAAAREAALYGISAIAVSIKRGKMYNYHDVAGLIGALAEEVFEKGLPAGTFLNVNVPNISMEEVKGVKISRQGSTRFSESFEKRIDPWNGTYYWHDNDPQPIFHHPDTDGMALHKNYISITPVKCDMTDYRMMECLKGWNVNIVDRK